MPGVPSHSFFVKMEPLPSTSFYPDVMQEVLNYFGTGIIIEGIRNRLMGEVSWRFFFGLILSAP